MSEEPYSLSFRLGSAVLAALVGLVLGFMLAIGFAVAGALPGVPFEAWVFATPAVLAMVSYLCPAFAFALFPAVAHMLVGAAKHADGARTSELPDPEHSSPGYLKISFYAGAVAVIIIAVLLRW